MDIHVRNNPHQRDNLVRDILGQFLCLFHPDQIAHVINADVQSSALGIRKTADPLQVFVTPNLLEFDILGFRPGFEQFHLSLLPANRRKIAGLNRFP